MMIFGTDGVMRGSLNDIRWGHVDNPPEMERAGRAERMEFVKDMVGVSSTFGRFCGLRLLWLVSITKAQRDRHSTWLHDMDKKNAISVGSLLFS